ncbi:MAG: Rrf2 family transcriptional regulator [Holophagae bacterium]
MRISKHEEFGLRVVTRLARDGGQLNIRELAEHEGLPETTIAKVVGRLRRAGVLNSERGRNGGYSLDRPADQVTLAQVVEAFGDRIFDQGFCSRMSDGDICAHDASCGLKPVWRGLGDVIGNFLAGLTVDDLVHGNVPHASQSPAALPVRDQRSG